MPQLGKITGFDLLRGPGGTNLALGDNCGDCCCDCTGATLANSSPSSWKCANAPYGTLSQYTVATYTIGGSLTYNGWYDAGGTYVCGAGSGPDPRGTWVTSLTDPIQSLAYQNVMILCDDATNYYILTMCIDFRGAILNCSLDGLTPAGRINVTNGITPWPKSLGFPSGLTSGWQSLGNFNCTGFNAHRTNFTFRINAGQGYPIWKYINNPPCNESCNIEDCYPKCGGLAFTTVQTDTPSTFVFGGWSNMIDTRGLTGSMVLS